MARRDARLAAREHLRCSLEQVALQGTELRLRPITHLSGQPTLPPALRVAPGGERGRGVHARWVWQVFARQQELSTLLFCSRLAKRGDPWHLKSARFALMRHAADGLHTPHAGEGRKQLIPPSLTSAHTTHMVLPQARRMSCCLGCTGE